MTARKRWHWRYFCDCGHYNCAASGGSYFLATVHGDLCPSCARKVASQNGTVKVVRWRSETVWWKPSTWLTGRWEYPDDALPRRETAA